MDVFRTLDLLIDQWCDRRAIQPLQHLLRAYPAVMAHTDQKFALLDALKDVRSLCRRDLTAGELVLVGKLCTVIEDSLRGAFR